MPADTGNRTRRRTGRRGRPGPTRCTASGPGRKLRSSLLEDAGQCVELLGNAARLADDVGQRHDLDLAVAPDPGHPTPTGGGQPPPRAPRARRPTCLTPRPATYTVH